MRQDFTKLEYLVSDFNQNPSPTSGKKLDAYLNRLLREEEVDLGALLEVLASPLIDMMNDAQSPSLRKAA